MQKLDKQTIRDPMTKVSSKANTESLQRLALYADSNFWPLISPYRYQMFHGGRGSGKSFSITESLILWADVIQDRFLLCREHMNSIADSCHALMEEHIDRLDLNRRFIVGKTSIRNRATGSEFIYKGLKTNINSVKSLNGIGFCFVEEGQAVSDGSWKILLPTIRKGGSRVIIACNPEHSESFMQKRWIYNPCHNTASVQVNYDANPYFPLELENERLYALSLVETAPNEDARIQAQADYDWVWKGDVKRIAAAQVIRRAEIKEFVAPEGVEFHYGMDFGFSNDPNALVRCYIDYKNRDLYIDYEAFGRVELDDLPKLMDQVPGVKFHPIYCDAARPETISHLRHKFNYYTGSAEKWQGSVEDGIAFLNQFHRIYIHPRCVQLAAEVKNYRYKVDKMQNDIVLPILIDAHNHGFDALRYALYKQIKNRAKDFFSMG